MAQDECTSQWENDVRIMAKRLALLYHYFAEVLVDEMGQEAAEAVIRKVIKKYGEHSGKMVRSRIDQLGLGPTVSNYARGEDLPSIGWIARANPAPEGASDGVVSYCPFAEEWLALKTPLARLYCFVDQAKYEGYNPELICEHVKNVLDGDEVCQIRVGPKGTRW